MARKPRIEYPGAFFHIIVRGNNRENVFRDTPDYVRYLEKFFYFCREGDITLYAYCLMPKHIHLLLEMGKISLSKVDGFVKSPTSALRCILRHCSVL